MRRNSNGNSPRNFTAPAFAERVALRRRSVRGFTLVELLLAIFILGIGIISVAALFPAGIAQQRQSSDDTVGAQVADSAMAVIRSKVTADMFGWGVAGNGYLVPGDFGWSRPAFFLGNTPPTLPDGSKPEKGSIAIFKNTGWTGATDSEIPWNPLATFHDVSSDSIVGFGAAPPPIVISQRDRSYPMTSVYSTSTVATKPQYVWDVMFRRFQGRIYAAIFVYRATRPGGEQGAYAVAANPSNPSLPPLPIWVDLPNTASFSPITIGGYDNNANSTLDNSQVPGTQPGAAFDPAGDIYAWQFPGQWLLDQNINVHRVLSGRRTAADGPVTFIRPVPALPDIAAFPYLGGFAPGTVTNLFYIPAKDANGVSLTPVFVTVKEL